MNLHNICFNCMRNKPDDSDMCPYCGFENSKYEVPAEHLPPMTPLNGKYILGRAKGQGGFGGQTDAGKQGCWQGSMKLTA